MSYTAAIDELNTMAPELYASKGKPRRKFVLEEVRTLLQALGNPHLRFPAVLIAGTNAVATDAVCTAIMGFDPMADRGTAPFEKCDSTLKLAEQLGVGTRDLSRIEIAGLPISKVRFDIRKT